MDKEIDPKSKKGIVFIITLVPILLCSFILGHLFGSCALYSFSAVSFTFWFAIFLLWGRGFVKKRKDESSMYVVPIAIYILYLLVMWYKAGSKCGLI